MPNDSNKKPKYTKITSPRGVLVWPNLDKPDAFKDAAGNLKGEPKYKTRVRFLRSDAGKMLEALEAELANSMAQARLKLKEKPKKDKKGKPITEPTEGSAYKVDTDEAGNETGYVEINFSSKQKPAVFDAKGKPIDASKTLIWGGSEGKIAFCPAPYYNDALNEAGVVCYLNAVQVLKLVSKGTSTADQHGFGVEDDGFEATEDAAPAADGESAATDGQTTDDQEDF